MVNWKSKYLEMKLKYINSKQKAGSSTSTLTTSSHSHSSSEDSDEIPQLPICEKILKFFNYAEQWYEKKFQEIEKLENENRNNEEYLMELNSKKLQLSYLYRKLRLDKEYWLLRFENINKDWKKYGEVSDGMRKLFNRYTFGVEELV